MYKVIIIAILLTTFSCKKNGEHGEPMTAITVKEYGSNSPIDKATVTFTRNGIDGQNMVTLFTGYTKDDGICQVPTKYFNEPGAIMDVSAAKYWASTFSQVSRNVVLNPEGWVRVSGIQTPLHVFPDASFINMYLLGQSSGPSPAFNNLYPVDTYSILLRGYAGEINSIVWQLLNSNSDTLNYGEERDITILRFDTIDIEHLSGY